MIPTHFIIHTIQLKPGAIERVKALFDEVVPQLARRFDAWCGARLTVDREKNQAVTIGAWGDARQMRDFLSQPAFAHAMEGFSEFFAEPPHTSITELLSAVGPRA